MSFRVEVIPEDPTQNGYILKPLVERLLKECGKARAEVHVLSNPRVQGYANAKELLKTQILGRYAHRDLLLFLPDADGRDRSAEFLELELEAKRQGATLLCCSAVPEIEVWLLAGHLDKLEEKVAELRQHQRLKEQVFEPFLEEFGDPEAAGGGRLRLMEEALQNYGGICARCPEVKALELRVRQLLDGRGASGQPEG